MDTRLLRRLRSEGRFDLWLLGAGSEERNVAVAYVVDCGWKVRVVPKHDAKINISVSRHGLGNDDRIQIAFSPFEDPIEIRDFILPLVDTETYREKTRDYPCREHIPGEAYHFEGVSDRPWREEVGNADDH